MRSPQFRLACCLCRKPIPLAQDVYALDAEWQRRFPDMVGILACQHCAIHTNQWTCEIPDGAGYVPGHIRCAQADPDKEFDPIHDFDSWCHIDNEGTQRAMVISYPRSGLLQGAEQYLRYVAGRLASHSAGRSDLDADVARRLQQALDDAESR